MCHGESERERVEWKKVIYDSRLYEEQRERKREIE